jgi:protein TonB
MLAALIWIGISVFSTDSPSTPVASEATQDVELNSPRFAPTSNKPQSVAPSQAQAQPATATAPAEIAATQLASAEASSSESRSVEKATRTEADAVPTPIDEVLPGVPRSALQTIRGTVRVLVRVSINQQGAVVAAASEDPGPSRYFERLALEASRKWRFAPAATDKERRVLVRFNFTREGATAHADALR